jgi:nitrate reductase delta subunit
MCCAIPQELQQAAPELLAMLEPDGVLEGGQIEKLNPLVEALIEEELLDLQEPMSACSIVAGLSRCICSNMSMASRDRGQAMVDLRNRYEAQGWKSPPTNCPIICQCSSVSLAFPRNRYSGEPTGIILHALAERLGAVPPYAGAMQVLAGLAGAGAEFAIAPADNPMIWPRWTPHGPRNRSVSIRLPCGRREAAKNGGHARPPAANRCAEEPDPWLISSITLLFGIYPYVALSVLIVDR